jgi:hypothetical protein
VWLRRGAGSRRRPRIVGGVWEDEAPHVPGDVASEGIRDGDTFRDKDRAGDVSSDGQAFGDRDGEAVGDRVGYRGRGGRSTGGPQTPKAKVALVLVVTLVVLATVVLCCMAIDQAARLIDVDPTRL